MSGERHDLDVAHLPSVVLDHRGLMWWGSAGIIAIEGFTMMLLIASYFYLRLNEIEWPPGRTPMPDVLLPTLNMLLLLAVIVPMKRVKKAAEEFDRAAVTRGLFIAAFMTIPIVALRWWDFLALHVRWDAHAYASIGWAIVVFHSLLLVTDLLETATMGWMFHSGAAKKKHFADASDAAIYQYFLSLSWVPSYVVVYWGPRFL